MNFKNFQAEQPLFTIDDEFLPDSTGSQSSSGVRASPELPSLLSVNQLLDSVCFQVELFHDNLALKEVRRNIISF